MKLFASVAFALLAMASTQSYAEQLPATEPRTTPC